MREVALLVGLALLCSGAAVRAEDKMLLGWIEPVLLDPELGLKLYAKLDTGADTSSLDAHNIRRVRIGDRAYVRFTVRHPETREFVELRKPFVRRVRIKRHGGLYQRRYVVRMQVCVGDRTRAIEINLVDRATFAYPMLLGRSALEGWSVVDPDNSHTTRPSCWDDPGEMPDDLAPNPPDSIIANVPAGLSVPPVPGAMATMTTSPALAASIPAPARPRAARTSPAPGALAQSAPLAATIPAPAATVNAPPGVSSSPEPASPANDERTATGTSIDATETDAVQSNPAGEGDTSDSDTALPMSVDEPEPPAAPPGN